MLSKCTREWLLHPKSKPFSIVLIFSTKNIVDLRTRSQNITRSCILVVRFWVIFFYVSQLPQFVVLQSYYINDNLAIITIVANTYTECFSSAKHCDRHGTFFVLVHLILMKALFSQHYYYSHFKLQKTEKQGSDMTCPW